MKHDLTTGTWQDDTGCPISIILAATSDAGDKTTGGTMTARGSTAADGTTTAMGSRATGGTTTATSGRGLVSLA